MLYKENWEQTKKKYEEFWAKENHDRPLMCFHDVARDGYVPKEIPARQYSSIAERWLDVEYLIETCRESFAATYFGAESFPLILPNLGPDCFAAFLGCELHFAEDTTWVSPIIDDWDKYPEIKFNPENKWWKKIKEMTVALAEDSKGDYIVAYPDLHVGGDAVSALRGPSNHCFDVIDNPERVKKATFEVFEYFKLMIDELYDITSKYVEGTTSYAGIWHPRKWYPPCNDFSVMISTEDFINLFMPEITKETEFLDGSIYHLDGAPHHLDVLLSIPTLGGIQWVPSAENEVNNGSSNWIPMLKKIQDRGKLIQHFIPVEELEMHLEYLKPEGVMYNVWGCKTEQDVKDVMKMVEKSYKSKYF